MSRFSGNNCDNEVGIEDCESSEYFYIIIDNGIQQDCRTNTAPECLSDETDTIILNGNYMTVCADNWDDLDDRCLEGEIEINENTFQWVLLTKLARDVNV